MKNIYTNSKKDRCPRILSASMILALYGSIASQVQAALPADAVLAFDPGQINRTISTIRLNTSALNVSAKATDESGNQRSNTATLLIGD